MVGLWGNTMHDGEMGWGECTKVIRLNELAKSEIWGKHVFSWMVNTGELNTNDNQASTRLIWGKTTISAWLCGTMTCDWLGQGGGTVFLGLWMNTNPHKNNWAMSRWPDTSVSFVGANIPGNPIIYSISSSPGLSAKRKVSSKKKGDGSDVWVL